MSAVTNERTFLQTIFPAAGFGDSIFLMYCDASKRAVPAMHGCLASFVFDCVVRQKMGGLNLSFYLVAQFPVLAPPRHKEVSLDILPHVLELTYTAWDLGPFVQDCGWSGPPFRWDEERRFLPRCELDAAFFHLYLPAEKSGDWRPADGETAADLVRLKTSFPTPRAAVASIMDTFPIVRRKDEAQFDGDYRTRRLILAIYDALAESIRSGQPYQTRLDPPPADPRCGHPPCAAMPQHGHDGAAGTGAQQPTALQSVS